MCLFSTLHAISFGVKVLMTLAREQNIMAMVPWQQEYELWENFLCDITIDISIHYHTNPRVGLKVAQMKGLADKIYGLVPWQQQ